MSKSISPPKFLCILRNMRSYSTYICRIYKQHSKSIVSLPCKKSIEPLEDMDGKKLQHKLADLDVSSSSLLTQANALKLVSQLQQQRTLLRKS